MRVRTDIISLLKELHRLEVDSLYAYRDALECVRNFEIKATIAGFEEDHSFHLNEIESILSQRFVPVPKRNRDLKGLWMEGITLLRSAMSDEQALTAILKNEEAVYEVYERALRQAHELEDVEVERFIQTTLNDEMRHYNYILSYLGLNKNTAPQPPEITSKHFEHHLFQ